MAPKRNGTPHPKALAVTPALYRVDASYNAQVRDKMRGRILDGDVILSLGAGAWMVVEVKGNKVTGIPAFHFLASTPPTPPLSWRPTERESLLLQAEMSVTAPMDLSTAWHTPVGVGDRNYEGPYQP